MADRTLKRLMDELVAVEETVHPDLRVYRWRPTIVQLPAIWNWMSPSPLEQRDTIRWRDHLNILVRVGINWTNAEDVGARVEEFSDTFRTVVDDALYKGGPLNGAAYKVQRLDMSAFGEDIGGTPIFGFQFTIEAWLDKSIEPR